MAENKKQNWFKRAFGAVAKYFRELRSDLKKVVWPTPKQVLKNTLIVVACVLVVGVLVGLFDEVADNIVSKFLIGTVRPWIQSLFPQG